MGTRGGFGSIQRCGVVGGPRITDPRGSNPPPPSPPSNDPWITDHLPHKPPPSPLPSKMIRRATPRARTKQHINPPICVAKNDPKM